MADIFISYAKKDRSRVEPVAKALENQGWSVFWDRAIPGGKTWDEVIEEELDAAKCVVVVWSKISIKSRWVRAEAEEGLHRNILVPVSIEDVKIPLLFRPIQSILLIHWEGDSNHPQFVKLISDLTPILGPSPLKVKEAEQLRAEEERKRKEQEEQERKAAEEEQLKEQELNRKAEEERKQKETEAKLESRPEKTISNRIGMKFVLIPEGNFTMGSRLSPEEVVKKFKGRKDFDPKVEQPPHDVKITEQFYLQTTEVSQGQWKKVMGNNPSYFKDCGDECPIEQVSWNDAQEFISKLNQMEGTNKYRLPTEAEWEYACRAKTETPFYTGECISTDQAIYNGNYPGENCPKGQYREETIKVGSFQPNTWGLYDMHGNVYEWCQDWYSDYPSNPVVDPKGPENGKSRVLRGGSWQDYARAIRSALRGRITPDYSSRFAGFRVARDF